MSDRMKFKFKNFVLVITEIFGRDIQVGDVVIFNPHNLLYRLNKYQHKKVPLCIIAEKGLCWYDSSTDTYMDIFESIDNDNVFDREDETLFVYKVNVGEIEKKFLENSSEYSDCCNVSSEEAASNIYNDLLLRRATVGDLVLVSMDDKMADVAYMITTGANELYNGYYSHQITFGINCYYIILYQSLQERN